VSWPRAALRQCRIRAIAIKDKFGGQRGLVDAPATPPSVAAVVLCATARNDGGCAAARAGYGHVRTEARCVVVLLSLLLADRKPLLLLSSVSLLDRVDSVCQKLSTAGRTVARIA